MEVKFNDLHEYVREINQLQNDLIICLSGTQRIDVDTVYVNEIILKECIQRMSGLSHVLRNDLLKE